MHLGVTLGNVRECPLVMHFWANLQSVPGYVAMATYTYVYNTIGRGCNVNSTVANAIWTTPSQVQQKLAPNAKC